MNSSNLIYRVQESGIMYINCLNCIVVDVVIVCCSPRFLCLLSTTNRGACDYINIVCRTRARKITTANEDINKDLTQNKYKKSKKVHRLGFAQMLRPEQRILGETKICFVSNPEGFLLSLKCPSSSFSFLPPSATSPT